MSNRLDYANISSRTICRSAVVSFALGLVSVVVFPACLLSLIPKQMRSALLVATPVMAFVVASASWSLSADDARQLRGRHLALWAMAMGIFAILVFVVFGVMVLDRAVD